MRINWKDNDIEMWIGEILIDNSIMKSDEYE